MLAQLLYEDGDMERAYQYMRFSWNATKFYNARLRSWQSADVLSLIDKTYQAMIEKQNDRLQQNLLLITALLVLLIVALGYIYRQMKKLADARNHLQVANKQLNGLNEELRQMNSCLSSPILNFRSPIRSGRVYCPFHQAVFYLYQPFRRLPADGE